MEVTGLCKVCGKIANNTCKLCGKLVCDAHFDKRLGLCQSCAAGRKMKR